VLEVPCEPLLELSHVFHHHKRSGVICAMISASMAKIGP
jgi:hypothetical protein